jgi:mannose-1-phosphate guanylyltransferase
MITVIIAGGSGTRLWPLSTSTNPKQLLKLTNEMTMVQNTFERVRYMSDAVYVVPDISHAEALKTQLPELSDDNFVVEPGRRGTASCIVAALAHVIERHGDDVPIAFVHADHHIRDNDGYRESFSVASAYAQQYNRITLIGIEPTYPATGFGYIEKGEVVEQGHLWKIKQFKEKPDFATAKQFISSGKFVWNCGYFVGTGKSFLSELQKHNPQRIEDFEALRSASSPEEYEKAYLQSENDAIDYALMERSDNLQMIPASFDWRDVGNFNDVHEANQLDEKNNYQSGENIYGIEVENSYIRNEESDKPIAVIGLSNVVVVNTKDGILVARKDVSHKVGDIAKKIQA